MTLLSLVNALLRRRWTIIGSGLLVAAAVVGVTLLLPRTYSSSAAFVPQKQTATGGGLSSVASQFGIDVGDLGSTDSPAFYADLLTSREIIGAVADSTYAVTAQGEHRRAPLAEILSIGGSTPELRRYHTMEYLREHISASVAPKTGMIEMSVTTPSAQLSHQIADRLLALVSQFNLERRQSSSMAERRFTEQRLTEVKTALHAAEQRLATFLLHNRAFSGSPALEFERDRLAREVSVQQQLYLTLAEAFERARIEEVRDTPVITVVTAPNVPVLPDRRFLALKALVGLTAGIAFGVALVLVRYLLDATQRSRSDEYAEFMTLRREAIADLKRPWRPLMGRRRRGIAAS